MPDPVFRFRKLTITLAIAIIASRSNGFSLHRMTSDDTDLRTQISTDPDQIPQESFKAQTVTKQNDITRDKDDGKAKNKYKFRSEIGSQNSTENPTLYTILDKTSTLNLSVTGLLSTNQADTMETHEDLKVSGLKENKFIQSKKIANTGTNLSGSTVGLSSTFMDNNTDFLNVTTIRWGNDTVQTSPKADSKSILRDKTTTTASYQENEYIATKSGTLIDLRNKTTDIGKNLKFNERIAKDFEPNEKFTITNENNLESTTGMNNYSEKPQTNNTQVTKIPLSNKFEKPNESIAATDILTTRADSNITINSTTQLDHVKHNISYITPDIITSTANSMGTITFTTQFDHEKTDISNIALDKITSKADLNSTITSTTQLDHEKNDISNITPDIITSTANSNTIITSTTYLDHEKNDISNITQDKITPKADLNSTTTSTTQLGHEKNDVSNITPDIITPKADANSPITSTTQLDHEKNDTSNITPAVKTSIPLNKNEITYVAQTSNLVSNSIPSSTTPLSNKNEKEIHITKLIHTMASETDSNSVLQTTLIPPDTRQNEKQSTKTEVTDVDLFKADQLSIHAPSTIFSDSKNEKTYNTTESTEYITFATDLTTLESKLAPDFTNEAEKSASATVEVKATSTNVSKKIVTEPSWKKYTTIMRKGVTSSEQLSSRVGNHTDLAKAESKYTTLPISTTSKVPHISSEAEAKINNEIPEPKPTFETTHSFPSETLGTVSSKRAGFLDLSKTTSAQSMEISTVQETDFNTLYETEATDYETPDIKTVKGHESRQLAEDALREELMKEEVINDHIDNSKVNEASSDGKKPYSDNQKLLDLTTSQSMTDDKLSVQPINQDKRTTLYTVGTNYKPMKRLEVQPAKPFVRDPDDNSWRNESISSLGIVFKPSNSSSKSYKEVLKTKTKTEFLNLEDKESKNNTPELRERLEKIAEGRKKKKMLNKFGEEVYTDYEEGSSSEGTVTSTPSTEGISVGRSSTEIPTTTPSLPEVTSPMTTTVSDTYWNQQLGMVFKEDIVKQLGLDILTTQKATKPHNLAEYYDSTDEYDAEYVTLPNIDLKKKFTQSAPKMTFPKLTSHLLLPTTRIVIPKFPERKATVQYFPPTTKPQKVNVNDYDVNFEQKVKLFTMKDTTPFEFEGVTTDGPRTDMRTTANPATFTMFTPHSETPNKPAYGEARDIVDDDGTYSRGSYVIKHFRDFLSEAAKDDHPPDFDPLTEAPQQVTDDLRYTGKVNMDYDYGTQLRKDVLNRFVNNFNQNSDRFKVDFPVLFNSSVVHGAGDDGRLVAQSSTFMKRLYGNDFSAGRASRLGKCDTNCEHMTVELSPAYELHYFIPEQEEKEEMDPRPAAADPPRRLL